MTSRAMSGAAAIAVQPSGPLELPLLVALHAACFAEGGAGQVWSASDFAEILGIPGSFARLAVAPAARAEAAAAEPLPVGLALARVVAEDCEVLTFGVAPPWRRRGVARLLLAAVVAEARTLGARTAVLEVAEDNAPARAFYLAEGFARIGRRPNYYRRAGQAPAAALVLSRRLET